GRGAARARRACDFAHGSSDLRGAHHDPCARDARACQASSQDAAAAVGTGGRSGYRPERRGTRGDPRAVRKTQVSSSDVLVVPHRFRCRACAVVVWLVAGSSVAWAQDAASGDAGVELGAADVGDAGGADPPSDNEASPADAHMPEPLEAIEPEYPPEAAAARLEASVVLRISIDAE